MKKKASTLPNMLISLIVITLLAGLSLGFVNDLTAGPKAAAKLTKKINALKEVLPEFNNNPIDEMQLLASERVKDSIEMYPAAQDGQIVGVAVVGSSDKGFSGLIKLMVGFNPQGEIIDIAVLEQKETPGLGTKIKEDAFLKQFRNKNPKDFNLKVQKDGGDVDALTGATITTRAFGEAVQLAFDTYKVQFVNPQSKNE